MKSVLMFVASVLCVGTLNASTARKYIFAGWALNDVSPQEMLAYADKFDKSVATGSDKIATRRRSHSVLASKV